MANGAVPALRVAALPILLAGIVYLETQRPFSIFRLVTFFLLFLLLVDVTTFLRGTLRDFLLIATSLVFGLTLLEAASDIFSPPPLLKTTQGLGAREPVLGWGPSHKGRFHAEKIDPKTGKIIYNVVYTIDSNLLRETQSCATCGTIAFFGDSFTFGEGLNDPDTLPQALADSLDHKMRVLNLAFSGYGPQQFLREEETGRFDKIIGPRPKLFLFLTAPWHAQRTACKASWVLYGPRYALENGKIVYKGPCSAGPALWGREWMEHTDFYRAYIEPYLDRLDHADMDLYIRILVAATHLAKEKYGVPTLIPYLRVSEAYLRPTGFTNDEIIKRLEDGGAKVVDVTLEREEAAWISKAMAGKPNVTHGREEAADTKIRIPGDGHPSADANRRRATILKNYIEQHLAPVLAAKPEPSGKATHAMRE